VSHGKECLLEVMEDPSITFVDGDDEIVRIVTRMLELEGYDVAAAATGSSALALLEEHKPDLRILDIMMLDVDGYTVCQHIRELSGIPIIMVVARSDGQGKAGSGGNGADGDATGAIIARGLPVRVKAALCAAQADSYLRPVFPRHALVLDFASN